MNSKRGPLTDLEIFYITHNPDKTAEQIAADIGRAVATIEKVRGKDVVAMSKPIVEEKKPEEPAERSESEIRPSEQAEAIVEVRKGAVDDLMGRRVRKGKFVATVMTPAASQMSDDFRRVKGRKQDLDGVHNFRTKEEEKERIKKAEDKARGV